MIANILLAYKRDFYNKTRFENKCRARIGDIVLIKEENVRRMKWRKGKIDKPIFGNDGLVQGVEILVYQSKKQKLITIKRPVQLVIPFELCNPNETQKPTQTTIDQKDFQLQMRMQSDGHHIIPVDTMTSLQRCCDVAIQRRSDVAI